MGVKSKGDYGISEGLIYSFPVTVQDHKYSIQKDISISDYQREMMSITEKELIQERELVDHLLN